MDEQEPRDLTVLRPRSRGRADAKDTKDAEINPAAMTPRVLKSRFVLDDRLGTGGMGTVYRAKDLRKVEARDRFPFVAVKVLNADIRRHPEAFIALEREASRSQQLSHHNIVSIYDFDKDGDVPFMTMELLQGRELATMMNAYPHGLPANMAWPIIEGMCDGLAYAHENGVVHADFKPGNVFVTDQNVVKILDFGLARAVRAQHESGEETAFDPSELAAMTPVYASLEMIEGEVPEAKDDLYSLAVVIYMVLTGRHPWNRQPADEALAANLLPERPMQLSLTQWRALRSALSFRRADRPDTVRELRRALTSKFPWRSAALGASAAALLIAVTGFYVIEGSQIDEVRDEVRQVTLLDMQSARVSSLIEEPAFDAGWTLRLNAELTNLAALDEAGHVHRIYHDQAAEVIAQSMERSGEMEPAVQQYLDAQFLAPSDTLDAALVRRLTAHIGQVLPADAGAIDGDVAVSGVHQLAYIQNVLERTGNLLGEVHREALTGERDHLLAMLLDAGLKMRAAGERSRVAQMVEGLRPLAFAADAVKRLSPPVVARTTTGRKPVAKLPVQRVEKPSKGSMQALNRVLGVSCLRFDLLALADVLRSYADDAAFVSTAERLSNERLAACIEELGAVDAELARGLRRDAQVLLDGLVDFDVGLPDPCLEPGPAGVTPKTCQDQAGFGLAPEVIVLEPAEGSRRLAVTREEISARDFASFCAASGRCAIEPSNFPVTGVPPEVIDRYAAWLSEETGRRYRLPTRAEWETLAAQAQGGTRHCKGKVIDTRRPLETSAGLAARNGLLHVVGNVRELVVDGRTLLAAGGGFRDVDADCTATTVRPLGSGVDETTGFRFVRELSS